MINAKCEILAAENRAAVDVQNFARDVPRPVGREKNDGKRNVVRRRHALQRNPVNDAMNERFVVKNRIVQVRINPARRDRVDANRRREFVGKSFGERDLPAFRCRVI